MCLHTAERPLLRSMEDCTDSRKGEAMSHDYRLTVSDSNCNERYESACDFDSIEELAKYVSDHLETGEYADAIDYEDEDEETEYTIYQDGSCDVRHLHDDGIYGEPVQIVPPRPLDIHIYCYPAFDSRMGGTHMSVDDNYDYELISDSIDDAKRQARDFLRERKPVDPDRGDYWYLVAYDENDPAFNHPELFEMDSRTDFDMDQED